MNLNGSTEVLRAALVVAGWGQFGILLASFQVPYRLNWSEELPRLSPFNRKLMWVYGGFTVMTIVAFGALTLALREEMLRGERAARLLAGFMAVFWSARVVVDALVFEHGDWPKGKLFALGHLVLTGAFIALATTYWFVFFR